ncbi:hypothetical protein ACFPIJ_45715 [Dactylosporangium cerinum]|uniref:Integral membrane protein n=1 Tax=Dactylosporangium cerinum TaxID=1434730 RepID=A0ABV9W9T7_9ACTN
MSSLAVAGVVAVAAVVLWTVLAVRLRRTIDADRRAAAAYLPGVEFDPYHAHAVQSGWPGTTGYAATGTKALALSALDQAALSALLVDGLITIDSDGMMTVTALAADPPHLHPAVVAWLECLQRAERPAAWSELHQDPELRQALATFLEEQGAPLEHWNRTRSNSIGCSAYLTAVLLGYFYAALFAFSVRDGILGNLFLTVTLGTLLAFGFVVAIVNYFPDRPNLLHEHCAGLPRHPATVALDHTRLRHLRAGGQYQPVPES